MALATVVSNRFFSNVADALIDLERDPRVNGLSLAMLVPSKALRENWSLVLASSGLDRLPLSSATSLTFENLRKALGEQAKKLTAVTILKTSSSAVKLLNEEYDIPTIGTAYQASGMTALALDLDDPVLFVSKAA